MERKIIQNLLLNKKFNEISRELKTCKKTIRKVFIKAKTVGYLDGKELPEFPLAIFPEEEIENSQVSEADSQLLLQKEWIKDRKEAGWHWITIWEELPTKVSRSSFFRFIKRHGLNKEGDYGRLRVVPEIVHDPGEALILDWGKLCDFVDSTGKKKTAWAFIGVLGFSRWMTVRIVLSNSTEETLIALESMLQELGGVPRKITSDNPKCFAIEASKYEPVLNVAFERFAAHYGFAVECLPPRDPQKKGKVERLVPFVRRIFGDWKNLKESQDYLNKKIEMANLRKHGTTKLCPTEQLYSIELGKLQGLPPLSFEREEYHFSTVRRDGHVRFRSKYYSMSETFIGKDVFIIGTYSTVSIYHKNKLIETHARLHTGNTSKSTKTHHRKVAEQIMGDNELYLKRAEKFGEFTREFIRLILLQGNGFVDTRKVWGILSLDKKYSHQEVEAACEYTLANNDLTYRAVLGFLESRKKEVHRETVKQESYRFVRNVEEYMGQLNLPVNKEKKICQ